MCIAGASFQARREFVMSVSKMKEIRNPNQVAESKAVRLAFLLIAMVVSAVLGSHLLNAGVTPVAHAIAWHWPASAGSAEGSGGFGWIGFVSTPMFLLLKWVHGHVVANWGWAIVVMTTILNVVLLPVRWMSLRSAKKLQRIQPQMAEIRERYKGVALADPRQHEMQVELRHLQQREGVNLFGGCLPMLLTWPLLFGFYRMLSRVAELHHAVWLWVPDLSAPDPHHVLPMLFVVSMVLSQLVTPSPGMAKGQRWMMAITLPLVLGFTTWHAAAGLALYWACGNVMGIAIQGLLNLRIFGQ
jgi:YidC/Oxa1 family membrane protein insertase